MMMKKILVIEDEFDVRENLLALLQEEGYLAIGAADGEAGAELASLELPDLIICDIMLPRMDGFAVLNRLSRQPETSLIPFIFLTALSERADQRRGMALGADDYIVKPYTRDEILTAVQVRLRKRDLLTAHAQRKMESLRNNITQSLPHEFLSPLSVILGLTEYLLEDGGNVIETGQLAAISRDIHVSALRLLRSVQNYLLFAELELIASDAQRLAELRASQTLAPGVLVNEYSRIKLREENRLQDLVLQTAADAPIPISEGYLDKILEELLDNAVKFSHPGSPIVVSARVNDAQKRFVLEVEDRGRGMPPLQAADLGGFVQFDRKKYEQQGTGLGLAIVRLLAELTGATMSIRSQLNLGTTITLSWPIQET